MIKKIMAKDKLYIRIAIGFVLGIILGLAFPKFSLKISFLGDVYLNMLRVMIIPILVCAIADGICNIPAGLSLKRLGGKTVMVYILQFFGCAAFSYLVAFILQPGKGVSMESITGEVNATASTWSIKDFMLGMFPSNIFQSMANNEILPVIIFVAAFSIAVVAGGKKTEAIKKGVKALSTVMFTVLGYVMEVSPLGVMCLMAYSMAEYGTAMFSALASYIIACWVACILSFIFVMMIPLCIYTKMNPLHLLKGLGKVALMTMSTTSSAATLPTTIRVCVDDFGSPKEISEFTLPLGCTINMTGGACEYSCLVFFVANIYGLHLSIPTMIMMILVSTLINMAAPGMPGGGIVLGVSFLSTFGLPYDIMGPIGAIYRVIDMIFTTQNVFGDVVANLFIAKSENLWDGSMVKYSRKNKRNEIMNEEIVK